MGCSLFSAIPHFSSDFKIDTKIKEALCIGSMLIVPSACSRRRVTSVACDICSIAVICDICFLGLTEIKNPVKHQ